MKRLWKTWRMGLRDPQRSPMSDTSGRGWANAFYGVGDYLVLPIGMLLAAPFLLRGGLPWSGRLARCGTNRAQHDFY